MKDTLKLSYTDFCNEIERSTATCRWLRLERRADSADVADAVAPVSALTRGVLMPLWKEQCDKVAVRFCAWLTVTAADAGETLIVSCPELPDRYTAQLAATLAIYMREGALNVLSSLAGVATAEGATACRRDQAEDTLLALLARC